MSEFHCVVVSIGKIGKLPNSDNLEITQVLDAYPCIMRTGSFKSDDLAAYICVDSLVPLDNPNFAFLKKSPEDTATHARIKAKKLRGVFSMGLLVPAPPNTSPGDDVQEYFKILKYEPELEMVSLSADCEKDPGALFCYDLEGLRKYKNLLTEGEEVVCTEKLHGTNARYVYVSELNKFFAGSHKQYKRENSTCAWWRVAKQYDLENKLKQFPDLGIFGEIYGQVQKGFDYGIPNDKVAFAVFDVYDTKKKKYFNYDELLDMCRGLDLPVVPELYRGPWKLELMETLSNGKSSLGNHIREGFVVRPTQERFGYHFGRMVFKMVGSDYLLSKNS